MNKVLPGLYVGSCRDSKDERQLREHGITHILSVHDNAKPLRDDVVYLCVPASDAPGQDLVVHFPACVDFIHAARLAGGAVLVHCLAGASRSVTVAVAYVMTVTELTWREALEAVRRARTCANPNFGFRSQLREYEEGGLAAERRRLHEKHPSGQHDDCNYVAELVTGGGISRLGYTDDVLALLRGLDSVAVPSSGRSRVIQEPPCAQMAVAWKGSKQVLGRTPDASNKIKKPLERATSHLRDGGDTSDKGVDHACVDVMKVCNQ
ncbi:PREDICTED: dual specificity protein phosphatase 22-like [Priapulus caudatus]|uniref:Dual specificity protein phosphatase 22-like n=1 Tax=Priapulus caudatus TaxID=37621 RepID=A0ABM1EK88_PRICU|nr:PREDICTED: dual specificity protein phosphatase 22-like [Priapulus caudatus]